MSDGNVVVANGNGQPQKPTKRVKSVVLTTTSSSNDYSNLQVREEDYPKIEKNDQVIVRIKASGLNFAELMQRQGLYKPSTKTPYTPGYEGSGIVEEVGSDVTDLKVNDRVIVFSSKGVWKEVVCLPRMNLVKMPDEMSFEDGAGLIVNYVTAYQILFRMANLQPDDVVLIHMAAGGVGFAATQLCKTVPGVVVIGTASESKHEAIRANGVDHPIDYRSKNYVSEIKKIFPDGVDIVLDPLNGDDSIKGYEMLRPLGRIVHYGAASMTTETRSLISAFRTWWKCLTINSTEIISDNKSISGYHLGCLFFNEQAMKKTLKDIDVLMGYYRDGKIKIQVDSVYPYSKIGDAMKRMHLRQNVGKIILKPDSEVQEAVTSENEVKISTTATTTTSKAEETKPPAPTSARPAESVTVPTPETVESTGEETKTSQHVPPETFAEAVKTPTTEESGEVTKPKATENTDEQQTPISA